MKSENQKKIEEGTLSNFQRIEKVPPLKMILYCSMAGMGVLFLILAFMFLKTMGEGPSFQVLGMPKLFSVSTVFILLSGFYINQLSDLYRQDNLKKLDKNLLFALVLGCLFAIAQVFAWNELLNANISFSTDSTGMLLFLLSALHLLHLAGGLAFVSFLYLKTNRAAADPIRTLIFIRDPFRNMQLEMIRSYWHFLGAVWVALYFLFLFSL